MTRTPFAPTRNDLKLLEALVLKAHQAARKPHGDPMPLRRAGDRAFKARMPIGHQGRDSIFLRLVLLSRSWWQQDEAARQARAPELNELASSCAMILDAPDAAQGERRTYWVDQ